MNSYMIMSDTHLRDDIPVCRTDNYLEAQKVKLRHMREWWFTNGRPIVLHGGDVFHRWKTSPEIISLALNYFPKISLAVAGQHDLPKHQMDFIEKSSIYSLHAAGKIKDILNSTLNNEQNIFGFCYGEDTKKIEFNSNEHPSILLLHKLVTRQNGDLPIPTTTAKEIFKKYPWANLIVVGDNHKTFVVEYKSRLLISPGSMMRMSADQAKHSPCFFEVQMAIDSNVLNYKQHFLPIKDDVISREHITSIKMRNKRVEAFVSHLKKKIDVSLSFEDNLKRYLHKNKVSKEIKEVICQLTNV